MQSTPNQAPERNIVAADGVTGNGAYRRMAAYAEEDGSSMELARFR